MITKEKARHLRKLIEQMSVNLSDEEALEGIELFPLWNDTKSYQKGDRVRYDETLYKCLMTHDARETWNPHDAVSLWTRVDDPSVEYPEWVQPESTNPYMKGDKVSHKEKHWESDVDYNVWEPGVAMWHEI